MPPLKEWLKPPRTLLLILFLLTLVSVSALAWFGWKLAAQDRFVEAQRTQERLEHAADRITATLRGTLAERGERLREWSKTPPGAGDLPEGALFLLMAGAELSVAPAGRLLYYPFPAAGPEARAAIFEDAEVLEFQLGDPFSAAQAYRKLAGSRDSATRAGALLRLARALHVLGQEPASRAEFERLAAIREAKVAGAPADLVARLALCEGSDPSGAAVHLLNDLLAGRWQLTRGQFEFYWSEASRRAKRDPALPADSAALARAAALAWAERRREPLERGQRTVWVGDQPFLLVWRGDSERRAALLTRPAELLEPVSAGEPVSLVVQDPDGRIVSGRRSGSYAAVRTAAESLLPWTLYVRGVASADGGLAARQRFLLLAILVMVMFLVVGTYFIGRAIRREAEVSRMQSDFVSAVSHEFRSPLTSMRQLSEILAFGRAPSEERRQVYYDTLVRETARLQRLVESLLNFGRMEAGVRRFKFELVDAPALVRRVAAEFDQQTAAAGRRIELSGPDAGCTIEADPEAISVALRNLVDNALKYSPGQPAVWVEWRAGDQQVAIAVRDSGPGIPDAEKKLIFRKFVRGSAAEAANVKGSGVGLTMVRHIVAEHGGQITLASEPGKGSTFLIVLPIVETT